MKTFFLFLSSSPPHPAHSGEAGHVFCVHVWVVSLLVCSQVAYPGEALPTQLAAEGLLPRVDPLVLLQVPRLGEHLPAGGTAERLLSRVDALVSLEVRQAGERLPARAAHEAPPPPIPGHRRAREVTGQVMLGGERDRKSVV